MITAKENVFRFVDIGKDCVATNGVIEGVVAYMYVTVADSYAISGANMNQAVIPYEAGVYPGGITRVMKEDGTTMVDAGSVIVAVYE